MPRPVRTGASSSRRAIGRWWVTHLYSVVIAVVVQASLFAQVEAPARELLNSERITAAFGSYGVEVLEQDDRLRVSNLYSTSGGERTCRTFAIVRYAPSIDPAIHAEHAAIVAGGSLGAVFAAQGWAVRKTHLEYGWRAASPKLAALMRVAPGTVLAEHVYTLHVEKDGRVIEYAALVEVHHPEYLDVAALQRIYGDATGGRGDFVAALRAAADERSR